MVIADASHLRVLEEVLAAGPGIAVQARRPGTTTHIYMSEARQLAALCARFEAPLFVSARVDVALVLGAHLHLPAHAIPALEARKLLPEGVMISCAVHDEREARDAVGADFALVSPVFKPGSKPDYSRTPLGVEGFERVSRALGCPAFALGGISAENFPEGARGAAVISSVLSASSPREAARALLARIR